ncbi:MAG: U32 family peptidase [Proteobacteria bacterium]|nr:U32 family peptidase [Pseudomonadota bacterium]MBU1386298.1 U32 family peptidase [Pseudomonadota bacterium]MBU1543954.1 U32 family peptidase [Pseudomonadota bacterium]
MNIPKILAPAGDTTCFLAAIAAGADAIYCGLKIFSARMEAQNFSIEELAKLTALAKSKNIEVYIALNSIIKESEQEKIINILNKLCTFVDFDGLIIQDPGIIPLARQAGFKKQFHLSTLGNCSFPSGLTTAKQMGFDKVVIPREFTIDEIKEMAGSLPEGIELEAFIHGALCYSVSGRCYWSSWFGGKSALRGRCVQPCRRVYDQKGVKKRHFSCTDFSWDVLVKVLKQIPQITTWKIEGRKKSPHYVYYTVKAYKTLRDDPENKKTAQSYLDYAMGRESTHYNLLSQRIISPLDHLSETASGLFTGRIQNPAAPFFITREALLPQDLLRIGFEDDKFHSIQKVTRAIPKKGKFFLDKKSAFRIKKGTPVHIIDRRAPELMVQIQVLENELEKTQTPPVRPVIKTGSPEIFHKAKKPSSRMINLTLSRGKFIQKSGPRSLERAVWISSQRYCAPSSRQDWLFLDPLVFPDEENICSDYIAKAIKKGAKNFIINSLWQLSLFKTPEQLNIWAGPFCNITNSMTIQVLKNRGVSGVIVSPELDQDTVMLLGKNSPLPLGIVIFANWPLGISRIISSDLKLNQAFTSPMGEVSWASKHNNNYYIFPNWPLDLSSQKAALENAGYSLFMDMHENIPNTIKLKDRPGLWNWNIKLL